MRYSIKSFRYRIKTLLTICCILILVSIISYCSSTDEQANNKSYLNLNDTVSYVGMETCKQCHGQIHATFSQTGMGKSFEKASRSKSSGDFNNAHSVYDKALNLWYKPIWENDSLIIVEYRIQGKDTIHFRKQKIQYIIGSGQHTNSHLFSENGYLFQAPLTFYTQDNRWDLPPGFENGENSRFNRIIGLECMSCHNGYPQMVKGSENKFKSLPNGIDCERCHGPGGIHVAEKRKGITVDTSKVIDYTIVNPGKLSVDLQFDLCQRCHLQGNAVLREGKSFFDFKPGMHLNEVMRIYLPRYENDENSFIMASHADRLKQSRCFIEMAKREGATNELRPYKNALTCVTCHNPHISVNKTTQDHFIQKCTSCHTNGKEDICSEKPEIQKSKNNNCISCHMPVSGSIDIPHVRIHDHYIRKQPEKIIENKEKKLKSLQCINDNTKDDVSMAKAYLQQFEKFQSDQISLLDSAEKYLGKKGELELKKNFNLFVQLHYLRHDFKAVIQLVSKIGKNVLRDEILKKQSWSNQDAWTAYRIGESYSSFNQWAEAEYFYTIANKLAPYYFEFTNKQGVALMKNQKQREAKKLFSTLIKENPSYAPGWTNYGYIRLLEGAAEDAELAYNKAISLDPDYVLGYLNLTGLYLYRGDELKAKEILKKILVIDPQNSQAKEILFSLRE